MSEDTLSSILGHLEKLVAFDSQNPPRDLTGDSEMFAYLTSQLPGFEIDITDHGDGHVSFLARRGNPRLLFNVHMDTVPVGNGWTKPPLELTVEDGRAYGRGTCDIKGAAACLLTLAADTDAPMAMLFTTDEEGAGGCCVERFCESLEPGTYDLVAVAEPTQCRAVTAHRGYLSVIGEFTGVAGHSSEARGLEENALHRFTRWAAAALEMVEQQGGEARFNLGTVNGGIKSNVIADKVSVAWSARLPPGTDTQAFFDQVTTVAELDNARWTVPFMGPTLPAADHDNGAADQVIDQLGLPHGDPVDFWTEASLFSGAGLTTFVLGPGDIAQAHAKDEWVALDQLTQACDLYRKLVNHYG
ncbi:MAG: acetylornithine deacetylase [Xanthomonadales bacterium]|nr:acetylornithine deacetylase [Xanthomonadales bacterium]